MSQRKRLDRERMQVYFAHLLMAYRPLILIIGILLLVYAMIVIGISQLFGIIVGVLAVLILLLGNFYGGVVFVSKVLAWLVTVGRKEE